MESSVTRTRLSTFVVVVFLTVPSLFLLASFLNEELGELSPHSSTKPLHPLIKNVCTNTLYPSLCFTTLSSAPATFKKTTTLHRILEVAVNLTVTSVVNSEFHIKSLFTHQDLNSQEKNALNDCIDMTDQTLYELGQAIDDLHAFPPSMGDHLLHGSYGNLKTLLSAAMTNENTCIDGFVDLEEADSQSHKGLKGHLQSILTPISGMISNCLAIIKYMETLALRDGKIKNATMPRDKFTTWMADIDDRKLIEMVPKIRPDIVVAADGSGHVCTIKEAITLAPNRSSNRFLIKINAGVYEENLEIPREKVNIMLVGDGMNSTVITGSKSFADGFSTFTSATLSMVFRFQHMLFSFTPTCLRFLERKLETHNFFYYYFYHLLKIQ